MTETTWEKVALGDLKAGDSIRATSAKHGDVIHGEMTSEHWFSTHFDCEESVGQFSGTDYTFERAVPVWEPPTKDGWYASESSGAQVAYERWCDRWFVIRFAREPIEVDKLPRDLVRLVPATEADELRERIEKAEAFLADATALDAYSSTRAHILDLLNGTV